MGNFRLRFSSAITTPVDSGTIVVSPQGTIANPSAWPVAAAQTKVSASAFTALPVFNHQGVQTRTNPRNMLPGEYWIDPNNPLAKCIMLDDGIGNGFVDYWEGGRAGLWRGRTGLGRTAAP